MLHTALVVILVALIASLALALIGYLLRPKPKDDVMQRVIGDAPRLPRGGYAALSEREVIHAKRST
jgi:hypothetical protein